jgi:hypothetical protein
MSKKGDVVEVEKRNECVLIRVRRRDGRMTQVVIFDEDVLGVAAKLVATQHRVQRTDEFCRCIACFADGNYICTNCKRPIRR